MMKKRVTLLYAVLVVVAIQLVVLVLLFEDLGSPSLVTTSSDSLEAVETGEHAAPLDILPGKRAPRTILESEGKLRVGLDSTTHRQQHQFFASDVITTPTSKSAVTSVSRQGKPLSASSSAAVRARMLGRPTNRTKNFVLETAIVAKPIVSSVPLRGRDAVSEKPDYALQHHEAQHEKQREERLKPPSLLRDSLEDGRLVEIQEERMARDMLRRGQQRRAEMLEHEQEEREERKLKYQQKKRQDLLQSINAKQQQKDTAKSNKESSDSLASKRAQRQNLIKEYIEANNERARKLDRLWKERKDGVEIGGKTETSNLSNLSAPEEYFAEVCEKTLEPLVECLKTPLRNLTAFEASGSDIMFTMRTTLKYHEKRLPVLFDTWLSEIEPSSMFIVTDGEDEDLLWKTNTLSKFSDTEDIAGYIAGWLSGFTQVPRPIINQSVSAVIITGT